MANSLSDKIAGILNTAPVSFDPEDDIHEETTAQVVSKTVDDDSDEEVLGKFRKQNVELLEDVDQRYKGKRASRKNVDDEWSVEEEDTLSQDSEEDASIYESEPSTDNEEEDANSEDNSSTSDNAEDSFKHLEEPDVSAQVLKGNCVRHQLSMWENLLEMRIQLQKCLISGNKLQSSTFSDIKPAQLNDTKKTFSTLLEKLLYLQFLLLRKYPETKTLLDATPKQDRKGKSDSEEEIPSDTEDDSQSDSEQPHKKKPKVDFTLELSKRHQLYSQYKDTVIQKWNDKTRVASSKVGNTTHSVLKQIDHILRDKEKLIKRTQLCRIDYGNGLGDDNAGDVYDPEVFDDTDYYHQLLRELIEYKSSDITDPVQLGRQWIQLQSLRSKMKRKIDTRATKGRKIRYAVHSKLVNFMSPIDDITWQSNANSELYNSLFGKGQSLNKVS